MPELPEVETIRRNLEAEVVGRSVWAISEVTHPRSLRGCPGGVRQLFAGLKGRVFTEAARRGKFLWLTLGPDTGGVDNHTALLFHLGMSGQLRVLGPGAGGGMVPVEDGGKAPVEDGVLRGGEHCGFRVEAAQRLTHERLRFVLDDGSALVFCDQRTFGQVKLCPTQATPDALPGGTGTRHALVPQGTQHIARDVLDSHRDPADLEKGLSNSTRAIKTKLLDQGLISGVGNIYADEALFAAGIHPCQAANTLSPDQVKQLDLALREVMRAALDFGGTSFDRLYVNSWGNPGEFSTQLRAYGRGAKACKQCGTVMERLVIDGRSSVFCPHCQPWPVSGSNAVAKPHKSAKTRQKPAGARKSLDHRKAPNRKEPA